jgi:hypothetical protein
MDETRQSARQRAACQAILVDAHCRVRASLAKTTPVGALKQRRNYRPGAHSTLEWDGPVSESGTAGKLSPK